MQALFIIHNQQGYFLGKNGDWLDGREPAQLYRSQHRDEAVNELFEAGSKNYELRLNIMECSSKGRMTPDIPEDQLPPPLLKVSETHANNEKNDSGEENDSVNETGNLFSGQTGSSPEPAAASLLNGA